MSYGSSGSLDTSHKPRIWALLKELNATLKSNKYLINNDDLTSADVSIWTSLWSTIISTPVGQEIAKDFPNVDRWITHIEQLPIVKVRTHIFFFCYIATQETNLIDYICFV